jgi:hypothetical protein
LTTTLARSQAGAAFLSYLTQISMTPCVDTWDLAGLQLNRAFLSGMLRMAR